MPRKGLIPTQEIKIYKTRTGKYAVGITKEDGYLVSTILTKKQEKELGL